MEWIEKWSDEDEIYMKFWLGKVMKCNDVGHDNDERNILWVTIYLCEWEGTVCLPMLN